MTTTPADPAAIDLSPAKTLLENRIPLQSYRTRELIAAVEALRAREKARAGALTRMSNEVAELEAEVEAAERREAELAGALDAIIHAQHTVGLRGPVRTLNKITQLAKDALAATPAHSLERARAVEEVLKWARYIQRCGHLHGDAYPEMCNAFKQLDAQEEGQ